MGGHGGLNILPQKKWNVYNRDNRLKVARDEAAYETKQQDLAEKHNAAEREHRRLALKERARQRHGGAATINLDALEAPSGHADGTYQIEEGARRHAHDVVVADPMLSIETAGGSHNLNTARNVEERELNKTLPSAKRQKREKTVQDKKQPAPSLAELARQLDTAPLPSPAIEEDAAVDTDDIHKNPLPPAPLHKHINLFEEEETRAKNPDKAAEQRLLLSKRGDVKTHTSDARFDESFQLGYGFNGGKGNGNVSFRSGKPWYAQHPTNIASDAADAGTFNLGFNEDYRGRQRRVNKNAGVMEKWKEEGKAALIAADTVDNNEEKEREEQEGGMGSSLRGIKVIFKEAGGVEKEENMKRHRKKKEKKSSFYSKHESKDDIWSELREERLRREQEEQKRQNEAVREASGLDGGRRRYFSTYGHGK